MFHFSDSHVSLETESWRQERVSLGLEPEDPMHEGHETERALRNFEQQVALAVERKADLIINTGDLLNLPSEETIAWVKNIIERAGIPFRFISGNHDWCFEGLGGDRRSMQSEAGRQAVRAEWREKRLRPLLGPCDGSHWHEDVGGVRLIAIDNSTCKLPPPATPTVPWSSFYQF